MLPCLRGAAGVVLLAVDDEALVLHDHLTALGALLAGRPLEGVDAVGVKRDGLGRAGRRHLDKFLRHGLLALLALLAVRLLPRR